MEELPQTKEDLQQLEIDLLRRRARRLEEELERANQIIDGDDPGDIKHRSKRISEALGIEDQSTAAQIEAIRRLRSNET